MAQIVVLGPIRALDGDGPVDIGGPTQRRLLATLVAHEGEAVSIANLLDALWGNGPPSSGPATIHSYVSRLRSALGHDAIETTSAGYRLLVQEDDVDALRFLSISGDLPNDPRDRLKAIDEALSLWNGPPFEDFDHLDFASRRLIETRLDLLEERANLLSSEGRTSEAIGVLETIISKEPFRESAWIALSDVLAVAGRPVAAIETLNRYRAKLVEIGLEPSGGFRKAEAEVFAAGREASSQEDSLPIPRSTFYGRAEEKKLLAAMIGQRRLVTLVGPGGIGKTRLALETARDIDQPRWLVRLSGVREESDVAPVILNKLGVESRGDPTVSVIETLRRSPGLLILDNCEHLIDSTAKLVDLVLRDTPTSVLATSREPLNVPGESLLELGPLDSTSASALYVDRATDVNSGFFADADQIERLCAQLDFMPLAIEMAAARSRALRPDEILERLDKKFTLLEKPRRGNDPRHRSLDAMVDWSYSSLPTPTQQVFDRLSVFVSGFDLDTASYVAGFGQVPPDEVPAHVADLVDRSMLERTEAPRAYRMLRVFRSFAAQKLAASPEWRETNTRHARWCVSVALEIGKGIVGSDEIAWVRKANLYAEEFEAALQWSIDHDDLDSAQTILEGLFQWMYHRQPPIADDWGDRVLRAAAGHSAHGIGAAWAAISALKRQDTLEALQVTESATKGQISGSRYAWLMAGDVACYLGETELSVSYFEETLRLARLENDQVAVVDALSRLMLAMVRSRGLFEEAMTRADELADQLIRIEAPSSISHADFALGSASAGLDVGKSKLHLRRALALARSTGNQYIEGMVLSELGSVLALDGAVDAAEKNLIEAMKVFKQMGHHPHEWTAIRSLATVLAKAGSKEAATKLLAAANASGIKPLSSHVKLWSGVWEELTATKEFESWAAAGRELTLQEAAVLAVESSSGPV